VIQGRPVEEVAQVLGWSTGSVRGRLARGRERLRERLSRRGLCLSVGALALLAPVAVPEHLLAGSVRNLASPAPAAVSALAAGAAPGVKLKAACLGLLVLAVAGLGAGLPLLRAPRPEAPAAAAPAGSPAQPKDEPRRDRYGDPLPPGAVARLGTLRFRAPDEVVALAFAPGGQTIAVSSHAGLFLFDAASGKRVQRLPSLKSVWGVENPLVFSPDGKRLAGRGHQVAVDRRAKGVVRVWELAGERKPHDYHAEHAVWVGWSADGEPLAVCLEPDGLRLHELAAGRSRHFPCKDLRNPESSAYLACACAPAGRTLAVGDEQGVVHVWDTATGRERCTLRPKNASVRFLALSPDGRTLASLNRDRPAQTRDEVQLWDATTGRVLHTVAADQQYLATVAFAPDGKTLATAGWGGVRVWDVATGRERSRSRGEGSDAENIAFSPDGQTLATAERHSGAIHLWDVATGARKPEPAGHRGRPHGTTFSPDGRRVATGGSLDGTIHVWDLATGASLNRIHRPGRWVRDITFSPDGRSLFSTWTDENLWVCDAATGERRHVIKLEDPDRPDTYQSAISMHLSDDGKTLVAFSYYYAKKQPGPRHEETLITGWDASTRKQLFRRRRPGWNSWLALSADARVLAVSHSEGSRDLDDVPGKGPMRLEDAATGEHLLTFPALEGQTWPLAFAPDGRLLASNHFDWKRAGKDGQNPDTLRLWEIATAGEVLALPAAGSNRAAFSRDGRLLAVAAPSQEILVWDLARGREQRRFKGLDAGVTWLSFSPDGRRLISGLADSTLLVWDVGPQRAAPGVKLGAEGVAKAWADLAGADAPRAFRARGALASSPEEAIALLKGRLRRAQPADAQRLRRLLADLESDEFPVREKAQAGLEELGDLAEPALRQALANKPMLEVHRRVQRVLERLRGPVRRPEVLRSLRAVAVLEDIATPAARELLKDLASGAPGARLTREAKGSLSRLDRRTPGA
jgi:WD40 repeat protein